MMTKEDYIKEYHASDDMMSDIIRFYKCNGLFDKDIRYLLEYAGEDDLTIFDIRTPEQLRCQNCSYLVGNENGDWICTNCSLEENERNIYEITDEECPAHKTTNIPRINTVSTDDVISLAKEYKDRACLEGSLETFICNLLDISEDTLYEILNNKSRC